MKILILTTKTPHHHFFIKQLLKFYSKEVEVFFEEKKISFPFKVSHRFESKRILYEKKKFFDNKNFTLKKGLSFYDINSKECIKKIRNLNPKIIIVFGTGKIKDEIINEFKNKIFNLHGGDPALYRGLDSHLWGIYHNDYNFYVTLHKLEKKLDTGNIIFKKKIIKKNLKIFEIRYFTTLICIDLSKKLIQNFLNNKKIKEVKLKSIGRYYSAMPSSIKNICYNKMNSFYENK